MMCGGEKSCCRRVGAFILCLVGVWHVFRAIVRGFGRSYIFFGTLLNSPNVSWVILTIILGAENGYRCKQEVMGAYVCVRTLLGRCLPDFWWGTYGVLVLVWMVGSIFWLFMSCGFCGL